MIKYEKELSFHFAFRSDNVFRSTNINLKVKDYIDYWVNNINDIKQIKRKDFESYYKQLIKDNIVDKNSKKEFISLVGGKGWQTLNTCPGITIKYYWTKSQAKKLDNKNLDKKGYEGSLTEFERDIMSKVKYIEKLLNFKLY